MLQENVPEVLGSYGDTRTDNDSQSVGSRASVSLRAERKRLDQNSRGARLNFRKGSPLGHTIEELDDRGMIDGGDTVPSYEASFKQRSRRPLEMRRRSSRLKGRTGEKHSPKIVNSFFHMVQVLIRRGLNFDELLRQYDDEGNGIIEKEQFVKICLSLGLPFGGRSLSLVYNRYSVSSIHVDYDAFLQDIYHGIAGNLRTGSDDSIENTEGSLVLLELRRMLRESVHAFNKSFDDVYRMFSRWDIGGTGTVTATQFLRVLSHLHIVFSEQDQDLIVELFDSGGEGRVDFDSLLAFCCQSDNDNTQVDVTQSPFPQKTYSYFGDDNTTSNSALSVGSVDNVDTSVEKLDGPSTSPDTRHKITIPPVNVNTPQLKVAIEQKDGDGGKLLTQPHMPSPDRGHTARSNNTTSSFQGGRPRPHTAGGDKRMNDGSSTGGGSRRESSGALGGEYGDPSPNMRYGGGQYMYDSNNSHGSNNGNNQQLANNGGNNIESPTSRSRRMVRPMTAAPRVPLTVSVPRQTRSSQNHDTVSAIDEFVVDVLSDDDVIDDDLDDALDLRSYEAATATATSDRERTTDRIGDRSGNNMNPPPAGDDREMEVEHLHVDEYNMMHNDRDIRQFKAAAAAVLGPSVYMRGSRDNSGTLHQEDKADRSYPNRPHAGSGNDNSHNSTHNSSNNNNSNYPPTYRAEPAAALKMLRRDIIHRHQKSGKTLYDIFRTFDVLGNRYFDANNLQQTMLELALPIDEYQANEMVRLLGLDGEDRVCFSEFAVFITDPDFPALADRIERIVAENYEKQGREYQLKLYNITMHGPVGGDDSNGSKPANLSSGNSSSHNATVATPGPSAITGFISKAAFEAAISELGIVASGNSKSDNRGSVPLLNSVEVSRLCVRFDTHGKDLCSVAKFLRMIQNSPYWRAAEQNVILMEEAAEEAQTAREELEHHASGYFSIGPPPGFLLTEELIDMAEYLGIRVLSELQLLHIVDSAVRAPVPEGWSIHTDKKGRNFFFHQRSGRSQWDHPADDDFRKLRDDARAVYNSQKSNANSLPQYDNRQHDTISRLVKEKEKDSTGNSRTLNGPEDKTSRLRPTSAKGTIGGAGVIVKPGVARSQSHRDLQSVTQTSSSHNRLNNHQSNHQRYQDHSTGQHQYHGENSPNGHSSQQHNNFTNSTNARTPYVDPGTRQEPPSQQQQQDQQQQYQLDSGVDKPDAAAIGDAVLQAMQGMDPADLLKLLNKNGNLLAAMGVSNSSNIIHNATNGLAGGDFTPQRSDTGSHAMHRHQSTPMLRQQQSGGGTAVLMVPPISNTHNNAKRATTPSGVAKRSYTPDTTGKRPSSRHNGSGRFDPMRGDRERMQAKRTHNWATPSAVDRALNIGKGAYGAPSADGNQNGGSQPNHTYHGSATDSDFAADRNESPHLMHKTHPNVGRNSGSAHEETTTRSGVNRPKSGSGLRQKLPPAAATTPSTNVEGRKTTERPKSSVQSSRSSTGATRGISGGRGTAPPNIKGPTLDDIYGDKLLTRLDTLAARGHHSP